MITDKDGNRYYKLALHLHTTLSDGKRTPEEVAIEYKNGGYDAIAFTDHWHYGEAGELCGLPILSGCEYNLGASDTVEGVMHIVGVCMERDPGLEKDLYTDRQTVVDAINAAGGIAVLAHPYWSLNTLEDARALKGVVATEIYNAVSEAGQSIRAYSDYFVDLAANAGIYYQLFATDDAHYYGGADDMKGFVMVKARELTREALAEAIRNGELYASQGPELFVKREGDTLVADTSPCSVIGAVTSRSWSAARTLREVGATHFEYKLDPADRWARVVAIDENGRSAYSRIFAV